MLLPLLAISASEALAAKLGTKWRILQASSALRPALATHQGVLILDDVAVARADVHGDFARLAGNLDL